MKGIVCCWLLAGLVAGLHGQTIAVNPKADQLVTDRQPDVLCVYQIGIGPINELHNLSILFSKNEVDIDFKTLASVDVRDGVKNVPDAEATGVINRCGASWLNITRAHPFQERAGVYKCVAKGFDAAGSAVSSRSKVTVIASEMKDLSKKLKDHAIKIDILTEEQAAYRARLQRSRSLFFHQSEVYKGRRYYLSVKRFSTTEKEAQANCELFGGYLAEYETEEEYQFIKSFLSTFPSYKSVLVSGSDELTENTWISQHTKERLKMIKWGDREPSGGRNENCLGFWNSNVWYVADIPCTLNTDEFIHGYLCEVPETED